MIELAHLAQELEHIINAAPKPLMMVLVPGFIIALATVATAIATFIEQQIPADNADH